MLFNFLKMELYRLSKMKSTYIMAVIMALVVLIYSYFILGFNLEYMMTLLMGGSVPADVTYVDPTQTEMDIFGGTGGSGSAVSGVGLFHFNTVAQTYQMNIGGLIGLLLIAIVAGLFYGNDYSTHVNKNYPIINGCRWVGYTAKTLTLMIYILAFHIMIWILSLLSNAIWAASCDLGISAGSIVYFLLTYFVTVTIVVMIGFVTTLFKSKAAGVTFGVLVSVGTFSTPIAILDYIISTKYQLEGFSLNHFIPSRILSGLTVETEWRIVIIGAICAIIYFISSFFGSIILSKKRDLSA